MELFLGLQPRPWFVSLPPVCEPSFSRCLSLVLECTRISWSPTWIPNLPRRYLCLWMDGNYCCYGKFFQVPCILYRFTLSSEELGFINVNCSNIYKQWVTDFFYLILCSGEIVKRLPIIWMVWKMSFPPKILFKTVTVNSKFAAFMFLSLLLSTTVEKDMFVKELLIELLLCTHSSKGYDTRWHLLLWFTF